MTSFSLSASVSGSGSRRAGTLPPALGSAVGWLETITLLCTAGVGATESLTSSADKLCCQMDIPKGALIYKASGQCRAYIYLIMAMSRAMCIAEQKRCCETNLSCLQLQSGLHQAEFSLSPLHCLGLSARAGEDIVPQLQ